MSWFWESNDGIWAWIAESDVEAKVEGSPQVAGNLDGSTFLATMSDERGSFNFQVKHLAQPFSPFIVTVSLGDLVEDRHGDAVWGLR